jgi:hypothetical protein
MIRLFKIGDCIDGDVYIATDMTPTELQNAIIQAKLSCGEHWTEEEVLSALYDDYEERIRVVRSYREAGFGDDPLFDENETKESEDGDDNGGNNRFGVGVCGIVYFMPAAKINGCADQEVLEKVVDIAHTNDAMTDAIAQSVKARRSMPKELPIEKPATTFFLEKKMKALPIEQPAPADKVVPAGPLVSVVKKVRELFAQ